MKASASHTELIDPNAVMRIKNLQLRAKTIVEGFYSGLHRSPLHGASVEFSEYRDYTPGDDPRGLDWKLFARSDRYFIKKFEDETNRSCYLVVDQSRSMEYASLEYTKLQYVRTLAASFAYFLTLQRDQIGLMTVAQTVTDRIAPGNQTGHLRRLLGALSREADGTETDLLSPLEQVASLTSKRGLVVLLSDCLTGVAPIAQGLKLLRGRGHEVIVMRILDPAETRLPLSEPTQVIDMESGKRIYVDPEAAARDYERSFTEHREALVAACDGIGAHYYETLTDQPLQSMLSSFVNTHGRLQKTAVRRGRARARA